MTASGQVSASMLKDGKPTARAGLALIVAALVASITLNVLLAHKVRSITNARSARISDYLLKVGANVPPITANRLGAQQETITYLSAGQPTVLYIFTPPCTWCARNMDNFKTLVDAKSRSYRFIGLSLSEEGLARYVEKNDLKLPIYSGLSAEARQAYKLSGTPQTIVISPEGTVLQNWAGAYVGEQQSQVEGFFHVKLPGLRDLSKAEASKN